MTPRLRQRLLDYLAQMPRAAVLPESCGMLEKGEKLLLYDQQTEAEVRWSSRCGRASAREGASHQ